MRFSTVVVALASVCVSAVSAATLVVNVGGNKSLTYTPSSINAAVGDVVQFQFLDQNHTVTQSTFATPCSAMAGGVNSGFLDVDNTTGMIPVWSFTVMNTSAPLWFYCEQTGHCAKGMVFAINPTAAKSFASFQAAAVGNTTAASTSASASGAASTGNGALSHYVSGASVLGASVMVIASLL